MQSIVGSNLIVYGESQTVGSLIADWIYGRTNARASKFALENNGIKFHRFRSPVLYFNGKECIAFAPKLLCESPILRDSGVDSRTATKILAEIPGSITTTIAIDNIGQFRRCRIVAFSIQKMTEFIGDCNA